MIRYSSRSGMERREEGFVLVSVAALAVVLVGFLALGVSMGYLYSARTTAQEIGDAAALAGAYTYITTPTADINAAEALAEYHAEQFALDRAEILGVNLDPADVTADADAVLRRVEVIVDSTQPTFFGRALGINFADVRTVSLAEAGTVATGESCPKPFFIPNNAFRPPGSVEQCAGCDGSGNELLVYDFGDGLGFRTTDYFNQVMANSVVPSLNDPDSLFVLKPTNPGQGGDPLASGQYYLIDFDDSQDNDVADDIRGCPDFANRIECFGQYSVQPGVRGGLIAQGLGLNGRGGGLLPEPPDEFDWDAPLGEQILVGGGPDVALYSDQLVSAPIWDVCFFDDDVSEFCDNGDFPQGTTPTLEIVGFATIFITDQGGRGGGVDDVYAYLIDVKGCGVRDDAGGPGPPDGSTVFGLPLRLVNENTTP